MFTTACPCLFGLHAAPIPPLSTRSLSPATHPCRLPSHTPARRTCWAPLQFPLFNIQVETICLVGSTTDYKITVNGVVASGASLTTSAADQIFIYRASDNVAIVKGPLKGVTGITIQVGWWMHGLAGWLGWLALTAAPPCLLLTTAAQSIQL